MASNLEHGFGARSVLVDVTLNASVGEWTAVVGASGSGKTTLLSTLGGLLVPDRGTVRQRFSDGHVGTPRVAWVLQTTTALMGRTVLDNAALGGLSSGLRPRQATSQAEAILDQVGLGLRVGSLAGQLSGGERQRLAIARALCSNREFILADEPTGQLDEATSRGVIAALRSATQNTGIVVATHDPVVYDASDRVFQLRNGRLR